MNEGKLVKEIETYKRKLPELVGSEGKYVVIHGDDVVGLYDSYEDALKTGYEKVGMESFLVKKISSVESVSYFTRDLVPDCHTSPSQ